MRSLLVGFLLVTFSAAGASAQGTSTDEIIRKLTPQRPVATTRSLIVPESPQKRAATRAILILEKRSTPVAPATGTPAVAPAPAGAPPPVVVVKPDAIEEFKDLKKELPSIDLRIVFEYNSDSPTAVGMVELQKLGEALQKLPPSRYALVGHTDAVGSDEFNLALSLRRSAAVRAILVSQYGIPVERLTATGMGLRQLVPGIDPRAEGNRRVEVVALPQ